MLLFVYNTRRISIVLEYIPTIEAHSPASLKLHSETFKQHHFLSAVTPHKSVLLSLFFLLLLLLLLLLFTLCFFFFCSLWQLINPIEMFTFFHRLSTRIVHHFICLAGTCHIWKRVTFQAFEIQLSSKYGKSQSLEIVLPPKFGT